MSDQIKHECGIALIHLKKPLAYYKEKYGTALYGINKMYLMMEKQHNRGQDGAGFASIKFNMQPGQRYISRVRSNNQQPIQHIFDKINKRIRQATKVDPQILEQPDQLKEALPYELPEPVALDDMEVEDEEDVATETPEQEEIKPRNEGGEDAQFKLDI